MIKPAKPIKPKPCKACRKLFTPDKQMQSVCNWQCAADHTENLRIKREASEAKRVRKETKQKLDAMKTIPQLIAKAQVAFNAYIRWRDRNETCICCGLPYGTNDLGGDFDCGHFRTRGAAGHLRFNEDNAFGQRKYCNQRRSGNQLAMEAGIIKRIGKARVEAVKNNNDTHKWTREELIAIEAKYKLKLKELKAAA
jgi:hypothetical protein